MFTKNHSHMMYGFWDRQWDRQSFCHSGPLFALLPLYGPGKSKCEKMKTTPENIIILQMCNINDSHMMYGTWGIEYNEKLVKAPEDIIILQICNINDSHMMYGS